MPFWNGSNELIAWGINAILFPGLAAIYYSDELHLENDHGDHWSWEPAQDMEMARYRTLLAAVGRNFL